MSFTVDGEGIRSSGLVQVSDGLYAEVLLWCASGPIARQWIVSTCVWRLSDCKNVSSCWKIATSGPVGRIVAHIGEERKVYKVLVREPEGKRPVGRSRLK
jgi:hypothetical protein